MNRNVSTIDRALRVALGVVAIVVASMSGFGSVLGILLLVVGLILLGTAVVGFCPLYRLFGIGTKRSES